MKILSAENGMTPKQEKMVEQVSELFEIMKQERVEELEITRADTRIHLKRKGHGAPQHAPVPAVTAAVVAAPPAAAPAEEPAKPAFSGETIQSPIMGMLYRAPSPSSPPFVKEGEIVDAGKTLCIVEAMKVMNEIKADRRMKIVKILVENGKSITANQDLFQIERA